MFASIACIVALGVMVVSTEPQMFSLQSNPQFFSPNFRTNDVASLIDSANADSRLFVNGAGAITLTVATSTSVTTVITTTTCTTSTAVVSSCSPGGGRRRRGGKTRSIFYADDEDEIADGGIFLPWKYVNFSNCITCKLKNSFKRFF